MTDAKQAKMSPEEMEKWIKGRVVEIEASFEQLDREMAEKAFAEEDDDLPKGEEFLFENVD